MSVVFLSLSDVDCHAISQVDNTLTHFLHFGVLHDVIFALVVWVGDKFYKVTLWHAILVPAEPIPAAEI